MTSITSSRPKDSVAGNTTLQKPEHEPIKKGSNKNGVSSGVGKSGPQEKQFQDTFCDVVEVKGNNTGGRPVVTKAANERCVVEPGPVIRTA